MRRAGKHSLFPSSDAGKSVASRSPLLRGGADGCGYVDELPRSILLDVISRLDGPSVAKLGMTCRRLREETRSGKVWRALAYAQESSGLCRDDLVTQDFTWRHLFAWRRHVLSHCDRGMNRLAVADAQRVLTCDPVEGAGGATRSTRPPKPFFPTSSRGPVAASSSPSRRSPPRDAR